MAQKAVGKLAHCVEQSHKHYRRKNYEIVGTDDGQQFVGLPERSIKKVGAA